MYCAQSVHAVCFVKPGIMAVGEYRVPTFCWGKNYFVEISMHILPTLHVYLFKFDETFSIFLEADGRTMDGRLV